VSACLLNPPIESQSPRETTAIIYAPYYNQKPHESAMALKMRADNIYFIIQVICRISDFHTIQEENGKKIRKYFSLTSSYSLVSKTSQAKYQFEQGGSISSPSPRITRDSEVETILAVIVNTVESVLNAGFITRVRDLLMQNVNVFTNANVTDAANEPALRHAYSCMLELFEKEILSFKFDSTTLQSVSEVATFLRDRLVRELGHKYPEFIPPREFSSGPSYSSYVAMDHLYLYKEFVAALHEAATCYSRNPAMMGVGMPRQVPLGPQFSPLTGKWTRLNLHSQSATEHPSWLYRLVTDVASKTWSIDDRGDEILVWLSPTLFPWHMYSC